MKLITLIGLAVVFASGLTAVSLVQRSANEPVVTNEAREYAAQLGMNVKGVSCAKLDTDGDGYVSCSINTGTGLVPVECAAAFTINDGCRVPKLRDIQSDQ